MNYLQLTFNFQNLFGFSEYVMVFFALHFTLFFLQKKAYHLEFSLLFQQFFQINKILRGFPKASILYPLQTLCLGFQLILMVYFLLLSLKNTNLNYYELLIYPQNFFLKALIFLLSWHILTQFFLWVGLFLLKKKSMFQEFKKITQINHGILAFFLFCIQIVFYFSGSTYKWIFLWISLGFFLVIWKLMHWIRLFTLAKRHQVFWLYLFCYICILEVFPILLGISCLLNASHILKIL